MCTFSEQSCKPIADLHLVLQCSFAVRFNFIYPPLSSRVRGFVAEAHSSTFVGCTVPQVCHRYKFSPFQLSRARGPYTSSTNSKRSNGKRYLKLRGHRTQVLPDNECQAACEKSAVSPAVRYAVFLPPPMSPRNTAAGTGLAG